MGETITLTFGDAGENHHGMQLLAKAWQNHRNFRQRLGKINVTLGKG
jgi:hypothetical protein